MSTTDENIKKQASKQQLPSFQIPLGPSLVTQMVQLDENRLFIGLKKDNIELDSYKFMMVDTKKGEVLWEYECGKDEYSLFWTSENSVVLKVKEKKGTELLALNLKTGEEVWHTNLKEGDITYVPLAEMNGILAYVHGKNGLAINAIDMDTGASRWSSTYPSTETTPGFVAVNDGKVFVFTDQVHVLDANNGQLLYSINAIPIQQLDSWLTAFEADSFYIIDDDNRLHCYGLSDGREQWFTTLPKNLSVTNIAPESSKVFINGQVGANEYQIIALSKENTLDFWIFESKQAITSNFLLEDGQLFFGNASELYSVDPMTGAKGFTKKITQSGRSFPISLRRVNDNIVHIGELVVVAFNIKTGALVYKHGFSPISLNLHFNGLDSAIPELKQRLSSQQGYSNSGAAAMASRESAYYQKMANESYNNYLALRQSGQPGNAYRANMERNEARINSSMSRAFSGIAMSLSVIELGNAFTNYIAQRATVSEIKRQEYYRSSILNVYNSALSEAYVCRPNLQYQNRESSFVALDIIALADGKVQRYYLSPQYLDYGLWNVVDFENGMIYHHGVGMDPEKYTLHATKRVPLVKSKTVGTFLIGQPMER